MEKGDTGISLLLYPDVQRRCPQAEHGGLLNHPALIVITMAARSIWRIAIGCQAQLSLISGRSETRLSVQVVPAPAPAPTAISTAIINLLGNYSAPLTAAQEQAVLAALDATFANFTGVAVSIANVQACALLHSYLPSCRFAPSELCMAQEKAAKAIPSLCICFSGNLKSRVPE